MRGFPPRANITFPGGETTCSTGLSTNAPIAKPGTVVNNTLLVAALAANGSVTYSVASTGFNATLGAGSSAGFALFWKFIPVAANETATTYTFTQPNGLLNNKGFIIPILGCDPSNPIEEVVRATPAAGAPVSPTIDPDQTGLTLLSVLQMITGGVSQTVPAGMTQRYLDLTASNVRGVASETLGPDTATGTRTWGVSGNHGVASVLLRPHQ